MGNNKKNNASIALDNVTTLLIGDYNRFDRENAPNNLLIDVSASMFAAWAIEKIAELQLKNDQLQSFLETVNLKMNRLR